MSFSGMAGGWLAPLPDAAGGWPVSFSGMAGGWSAPFSDREGGFSILPAGPPEPPGLPAVMVIVSSVMFFTRPITVRVFSSAAFFWFSEACALVLLEFSTVLHPDRAPDAVTVIANSKRITCFFITIYTPLILSMYQHMKHTLNITGQQHYKKYICKTCGKSVKDMCASLL